jgi:hypothetical protein
MIKQTMIALAAMLMFVGAAVQAAEENAGKCECGDKCDEKTCACPKCCCATVPAVVKEAAMKSCEGIKIVCIHMTKDDTGAVYTCSAMVGDKPYTVTVTCDKDGKVTQCKATVCEAPKVK